RHNFHPASIFMGDAGSMFLGYLLAVSALVVCQEPSNAVGIEVPLAVLALPIADTSLSIARRILRGRSIFSADREHIHHALLDAGKTMADRLRGATTVPEVLEMLAPIPEAVSASRVVAVVPAAGLRRAFHAGPSAHDGPLFSARFAIGRPAFGDVEVHWNDGR